MYSINRKFLNSDADILLNKALKGKQFAPVQPVLYLKLTIKKKKISHELRHRLSNALEPFTVLKLEFGNLENDDIQIDVELGTSHHPNTILSVLELVLEKNTKTHFG